MINLSKSLGDLFGGILPNVYVFSASLLSFLILFAVVTFFVYRPIKKYIAARKKFFQDQIDSTINAQKEAKNHEEQAQNQLLATKKICVEMKEKSEIEANKFLEDSKKNASIEAKKIIKDGQKIIDDYQNQINVQNQENIINIAVEISRKYLIKQKKDNEELHKKLLIDLEKELSLGNSDEN
ncbi:ATP synthase F0 subunit B [Mycoplasma sp. 'Moose RK']|uniref:ATP synthase F0 subunit B n=1 Tax=Mycoplasma sp. 'Moose RK' TaxID=2780095 RepID=UPI0018C1FD49|nr:ATP synthase F0 subunit B [Mycoplasma sp. 'Moose RK']MBG0731006.1 ATP synthase F0 subunit B [Mycoplasma sp. 'Moose RK']